jgi:glycyl-tRNA synthetase beta chain
MVGEFPELQGVMGGYYARHDGETEAVALAVEDHYRPRFAGDALPRGDAALVVALADKLETLAGLFGIGQLPTGDKDPFALRRHALGVIRMLIERGLPLAVPQFVATAFHAFPASHGQAQAEVAHFLYERLVGYLRELGYSAHEVDAVVALRPPRWAEIPQRLAAVRAFAALPEAPALAAANKRVGNILKKSDGAPATGVNPELFAEPAETALHAALAATAPRADAAFERGDYTASLQALAALKAPVDAFFDSVMVNADDPALRNNRLALLGSLHAAMNRVADLSRLAS